MSLKLQSISKTFEPGTITSQQIFLDLNLEIAKSSFVTVIGGNGAGKSSLLNLISGQFFPDRGSIWINEREVTHLGEYQRASMISRVFQNPSLGTAPSLTVAENLGLAMRKRGAFSLRRAFHKREIAGFRELVAPLELGLEDKMDIAVKYLSGGQRQALTLIMATLVKPEILLLDEHTAALDPKTAQQILSLTKTIVKKNNLTTIMVTHNLEQAIHYGDRLLMFNQGKIILDIREQEKREMTVSKLLACFSAEHADVLDDRLLF